MTGRGGSCSWLSVSAATNVLRTIDIPTFNSRTPVARDLSRLGGVAAEEARGDDQDGLMLTEVRIDEAAARLWDIGSRSQDAITASLAALG